jgi:phosphoglycolate phosphatase
VPDSRNNQETSGGETGQVTIRPGFAWDGCDAYLFDIDGTLLHAKGGVHIDAFSSSVLEILGQPLELEGVRVHGNTDTGILRDAFHGAAIANEVWEPRLEEILERMRETVMRRREHMPVAVYPGVVDMLAYLKGKGKLLGVATGNLEQIGWLKIEIGGLRDWFSFGGFSDRFVARPEMIGYAAAQARLMAGENATVCVVGDTPSDIEAARANSLPTIAVATGIFSCEQLLEHTPEVCASSLEALLAYSGDS